MNTNELTIAVVIWRLKPRGTLLVTPRGEAAPFDHTRVKPTFFEKELACLVGKPRANEEPLIAACIERLVFMVASLKIVRKLI